MARSKRSEVLAARVQIQMSEQSGEFVSKSVRRRAAESLRQVALRKPPTSGTPAKRPQHSGPREEVVDLRTRQVIVTAASFDRTTEMDDSRFNAS